MTINKKQIIEERSLEDRILMDDIFKPSYDQYMYDDIEELVEDAIFIIAYRYIPYDIIRNLSINKNLRVTDYKMVINYDLIRKSIVQEMYKLNKNMELPQTAIPTKQHVLESLSRYMTNNIELNKDMNSDCCFQIMIDLKKAFIKRFVNI